MADETWSVQTPASDTWAEQTSSVNRIWIDQDIAFTVWDGGDTLWDTSVVTPRTVWDSDDSGEVWVIQ